MRQTCPELPCTFCVTNHIPNCFKVPSPHHQACQPSLPPVVIYIRFPSTPHRTNNKPPQLLLIKVLQYLNSIFAPPGSTTGGGCKSFLSSAIHSNQYNSFQHTQRKLKPLVLLGFSLFEPNTPVVFYCTSS